MFEQHMSLVLAIISLMATGITLVTFFMKLKWDSAQHEIKLQECKTEIDTLRAKLESVQATQREELHTVLVKIDSIDKAVIGQMVTLKYIEETVRELKDAIKGHG